MRLKGIYLAIVGVILLFVGCEKSTVDKQAEKQKLMELSQEWSEIASTGSIDSLMTYWADDAVMMPPNKPPLKGKDEIRSYVEASGQIPGFEISWEPQNAYISEDGSMAYIIERNQIAFNDSLGNRVVEHNKVVTVWRKNEDGNWKNVIDMWNSVPSK